VCSTLFLAQRRIEVLASLYFPYFTIQSKVFKYLLIW